MPDGVKFCSECGSKTNDVVQEHNNEKDSLNHIISELKGSFLNSKKLRRIMNRAVTIIKNRLLKVRLTIFIKIYPKRLLMSIMT